MHKHTGYVLNADVGMPLGVAELDENSKLSPETIPTLKYTQNESREEWIISHNLNRFPSIIIVDSAGSKVEGDINYVDANNLKITFGAAFAGTIYVN